MIYDPYAEQMQVDPYPTYRHFLEDEPCTYNSEMDIYAIFRFEDVRKGPVRAKLSEMPSIGGAENAA